MANRNKAFIGLGSNLRDPTCQLQTAIKTLAMDPNLVIEKISSFYANPPLGSMEQPDFVNAVIKIKTNLLPEDLLRVLQKIEKNQYRERLVHWGPRTLDLDLLLFNNEIIQNSILTIPHPGLTMRSFVIYPLLEIEENLILPNGIALKNYQLQVNNNLTKLTQEFTHL